jgi:hypothetical protein
MSSFIGAAMPSEEVLSEPQLDTLAQQSIAAAAREELEAIEHELRRRLYLRKPVQWAQERLHAFLWSLQAVILESVRDHRKTAVRSCHGPGKSWLAAAAIAWWIDSHRPGEAFAITSAPTGRQVKAILWRYLNRLHASAQLPGRMNQTEWYIQTPTGKEELCAFGQKPADYDPAAFQGIHERALLLVLDEAGGIPKSLWTAGGSLLTNDACRELAIGNPDDPTSEFAEVCKPGTAWHTISISAFQTPNLSGEPVPQALAESLVGRTWIEEARAEWAPSWQWVTRDGFPSDAAHGVRCEAPQGAKPESVDPFWHSKVLGQFPPKGGPLSLIPSYWIEEAQDRSLPAEGPDEFGVDVGAGGDSSTVGRRRGSVFRILSEDHNPNTMQTCGNIISLRREALSPHTSLPLGQAKDRPKVKVDKIGIGAGIVDRANELGEAFDGVNVGLPAEDTERFANHRAESWWHVRERFASGEMDIDPADAVLAKELTSLRYWRTSAGKIIIESKAEALKRGIRSPNRADSLMLAFCTPKAGEEPLPLGGLLW